MFGKRLFSYGYESILKLLKFEFYRQCVGYTHCTTLLLTWLPPRHRLYNPYSFIITTATDASFDVNVHDRTVCVDNEPDINSTFNTIFTRNSWVFDVLT